MTSKNAKKPAGPTPGHIEPTPWRPTTSLVGEYCIVRANDAGVMAGIVTWVDLAAGVVALDHARGIWFWSGAATLTELATKGPAKPGQCKFPAPVDRVTMLGVCQIIVCTSEGRQKIEAVPAWTAHED